MVYSAQLQVPIDAANSPEAQQLILRLHDLGVKVVAGSKSISIFSHGIILSLAHQPCILLQAPAALVPQLASSAPPPPTRMAQWRLPAADALSTTQSTWRRTFFMWSLLAQVWAFLRIPWVPLLYPLYIPATDGSWTYCLQALADSFVMGVKCSVRKKYSSLESALGALQSALSIDTIKLLQKNWGGCVGIVCKIAASFVLARHVCTIAVDIHYALMPRMCVY